MAPRILIFLLSSLLLLTSSCNYNADYTTKDFTKEEYTEESSHEVIEISSPYTGLNGNAVWDMKIYNGHLYIGAGNYDKNTSVDTAYRYDLSRKVWEACGQIPDEQIGRFVVLNDQLVLPGIDPVGDWSLGNYYVLQNDSFATIRTIPNAIHNFDIVEYDNKLFFGLGVSSGNYPVAFQNGDKYKEISFVDKNGNPLSTKEYKEIRAYDLVVLNSSLYALVQLDSSRYIYKYNGINFEYYCDYNHRIIVGGYSLVPLLEKQILKDTLFFTTGLLYKTENMKDLQDITPSGVDYVADLLNYNGRLFILANQLNETQKHKAIIFELLLDGSFSQLTEIEVPYPAMAFECDGNAFYIGTGTKDSTTKVANKILIINYKV